jgi:uncharacterized protein YyaL (SSP411 family)
MSRLGDAISPYLVSHANQPVDWYPWGAEAFEVAAARNVPVMISIGYHTCHWCHVMSRESFSDPDIARVINDNVVAIKVDREEHPEVDAAYMAQAQAFSDNLGWPLNVFTTPNGHAFYAVTYLPPVARDGLPSTSEVITAVATAWQEKREEVLEMSRSLVESLAEAALATSHTHEQVFPSHVQLAGVVEGLVDQEDVEFGGFGGAPKFPVAPVVGFLLGQGDAGNETAHALATRLLERYRDSPLRDPVEGGFFRYATRRDFSEPHYERMLFDNAGLLAAYARAGDADTAAGIVSFFRNQLFVDGALASAQDSESVIDGVSNEGGYFRADAEARAHLAPPAIDNKIVTSWNGLALEALAIAHRMGVAGDPGQLGTEIAQWLLRNHLQDDGSLVRISRDGLRSNAPATAEDFGGLALGLIELGLAIGDAALVGAGKQLVDKVLHTPEILAGDPVLSSHGLDARGDISEGASPSGQALLALAALRLAALTGEHEYRDFARHQVAPYLPYAMLAPLGYGGVLRVLSELASPPRQAIVVADGATELAGTVQRWRREGMLSVSVSSEQASAFLAAGFTLFEGRLDGSTPIAYVCEAGVCRMPVVSASELRHQLAG